MDFLSNNWATIIIILAVLSAAFVYIKNIVVKSTEEQIALVKKWLLWAVTEAEKELGSGTGKLKLTAVYDMFVERFPWVAKIVSFERFSTLVDEALEEMRDMLQTNEKAKEYVEGE